MTVSARFSFLIYGASFVGVGVNLFLHLTISTRRVENPTSRDNEYMVWPWQDGHASQSARRRQSFDLLVGRSGFGLASAIEQLSG
jgi:hypothetical protein